MLLLIYILLLLICLMLLLIFLLLLLIYFLLIWILLTLLIYRPGAPSPPQVDPSSWLNIFPSLTSLDLSHNTFTR